MRLGVFALNLEYHLLKWVLIGIFYRIQSMFVKPFSLATLLFASFIYSTSTFAIDAKTSITDSEQKLKKYQWLVQSSEKELTKSNDKLSEDQKTLDALNGKIQPIKDKFFAAKRSLDTLKNKAGNTPTLEQKSRIKNEEFKFILIESKYDDLEKQITDIENSIETSIQKIENSEQKIASYKNKIRKQRAAISQKKTLAAEQKNIEALSEVERLRQMLAAKEQEISAAKALAEKANIEIEQIKANQLAQQKPKIKAKKVNELAASKTPVTSSTDLLESSNKNPLNEPTIKPVTKKEFVNKTTKATPEQLTLAKSTSPFSAKRVEKPLPTEGKVYAQEAMKRFSAILELKNVAGGNRKKNRLITVKNEASRNNGAPKILEAKGNHQYKGRLKLNGGKYVFQVGQFKHETVLPKTEKNKTYVVLFDARPGQKPRLDIFEKSLLN